MAIWSGPRIQMNVSYVVIIVLEDLPFHSLCRVLCKHEWNMWHDQGNESDVANTDFELQAKTDDIFLCFTLFWNSKNCSYLLNQMADCNGYGSRCRIRYVKVDYIENSKLNIANKWLISLDHVTYGWKSTPQKIVSTLKNIFCFVL